MVVQGPGPRRIPAHGTSLSALPWPAMEAQAPLATCSLCGDQVPRTEMFGIEPDLACPPCADGVRSRMRVRARPQMKMHKPVVITGCIALCVVFFLAYQTVGKGGKAAWLGALHQRREIWIGEWWRHLSVVFMHTAIWHIAMNLITAWSIGRIVEMIWGSKVTLLLVLVTGIAASALEWMMSGPGIGFSGALMGLIGFLWGQRTHHPVANHVMDARMRNWIITMMVVMVVLTQTGSMAIGNWAHGGGFAVGWLLGQGWIPSRRKWAAPAVVVLVVGLVVAAQFRAFGEITLIETNAAGESRRVETPRQEWREVSIEQLESRR